ncbi:MAG: type I-C CRISPR-associated protein Cas5c [Burkholderiales bacterium]
MTRFCLEISGPFACFTRPEMKVERVSYDVITPSAARAVYESILWKPQIRWHMRRIDILKPVRWINLRRNEVGKIISTESVRRAMEAGTGDLALYVEDERQQRAGLFLRDVAYRVHADLELLATGESAAKYSEMFKRRAEKGQWVNQPYLGCREFAATVRLVEDSRDEPMPLADIDGDLGWMLFDLDFSNASNPAPKWFRACAKRGVIDLTTCEVRG